MGQSTQDAVIALADRARELLALADDFIDRNPSAQSYEGTALVTVHIAQAEALLHLADVLSARR